MSEQTLEQVSRGELVTAFSLWEQRLGEGVSGHTLAEWEALTPQERAELWADYMIKLIEEVKSC